MAYRNHVPFYLFIIVHLFLKIESFTPAGRDAYSSVLVENKLYFFGGTTKNTTSNEVFYLDVSQPFHIQAPPWNDLTQSVGMPFKTLWATASLSNINNEQTIYFFGGITKDIATDENKFMSIIYSFNLSSLMWDVPTIKGMQPERRRQMSSVIDNAGNMYIFGGGSDEITGAPKATIFNEMVIFNTIDLSWSIIKSPVIGRVSYTATLLPNGIIVYTGGYDSSIKTVDISQIALYDTKTLTWSNKVCMNH
jgi:N-acetylneuraminic acid mutarotase